MKRILWTVGMVVGIAANTFSQTTPAEARTTESVEPQKSTPSAMITLPAGTHVVMSLTSPIHTTSAKAGTGVYLETTFPVVQDNEVVIPAHSRVLGEVEHGRRPGRVKGRAQLRLRFTRLIFPDNRVVAISGGVQSLPGDGRNRTKDAEGTIEPVDQIDDDLGTMAAGTIAGGLAGALTKTGTGAGIGVGIGGGLALARILLTRGDEIHLPEGTKVEMVLQKPLMIAAR